MSSTRSPPHAPARKDSIVTCRWWTSYWPRRPKRPIDDPGVDSRPSHDRLNHELGELATLFISDLHLRPKAPRLTEILLDLLRGPAVTADALYVLGDLFEAWPGDDDASDPFNAPIVAGFRDLTRRGVPVHFQH